MYLSFKKNQLVQKISNLWLQQHYEIVIWTQDTNGFVMHKDIQDCVNAKKQSICEFALMKKECVAILIVDCGQTHYKIMWSI